MSGYDLLKIALIRRMKSDEKWGRATMDRGDSRHASSPSSHVDAAGIEIGSGLQRSLAGRLSWVSPGVALLFLGCFLYVWLRIEPALQFQALGPVFLISQRFFQEHCLYPGGLIDYAAAFILQFYRFSWFGALLTTALAGAICFALRRLLARSGWPGLRMLPFAAVVLLLAAQSNYSFAWMGPALSMLLALVAANAYLIPRQWSWRLTVFCLCCLLLYYLLGGGFLLYVLLCAVCEGLIQNRRWQGLAYLVAGATIPYAAANTVFVITLEDAYLYLTPFSGVPRPPLAALALFFLGPCLLLTAKGRNVLINRSSQGQAGTAALSSGSLSAPKLQLAPKQRNRLGPKPPVSQVKKPAQPGSSLASRMWTFFSGRLVRRLGHPAIWTGLAAAWLGVSFDSQAKLLMQVEYYTQHQQWDRALQAGSHLKSAVPSAICDIDRALSHTDRLLEEMFHYPQKLGLAFWFDLHHTIDNRKLLKASDLLFELGHINRAERFAAESLELNGYQPGALKQLFLVSVLKGDARTGLPFLNLLGCTLWGREVAAHYRQELAADPQLSHDPELQQVRSVMLTRDYVGVIPDNTLMLASLHQNPHNHMAFAYLMAYYLLNRQLEKLAQSLDRWDAPDGTPLPWHIQEALALLQGQNPQANVNLHGLTLSPVCLERYKVFQNAVSNYRSRLEAGEADLAPQFGDTYWYYYLYGHSGCVVPTIAKEKQ